MNEPQSDHAGSANHTSTTVNWTTDADGNRVGVAVAPGVAKRPGGTTLTGDRDLAIADVTPLLPSSDCDLAGRACAAGLYCDGETGVCTYDSAAPCGDGVDVAPLASGTEISAGIFQFDGLVTPAGSGTGLGLCGTEGTETAILFEVGSGDWDVLVESSDAFHLSVVEGYCSIDGGTVCEASVDGQVSTFISTSAETAKYLLIESAVPGATATVRVTATPAFP